MPLKPHQEKSYPQTFSTKLKVKPACVQLLQSLDRCLKNLKTHVNMGASLCLALWEPVPKTCRS